MILRHADVKAAAKDWHSFSSDAPFRVPIPSEEEMRPVRQLPIELDPPEHTVFRKIVEPFFKRARLPEVVAGIADLVERHIAEAIDAGEVEVIRDLALPLQSRALTHLLNVPESDAEEWIEWGIHVFHDGDSVAEKGTVLDQYIEAKFDQVASETPDGDDFFSALNRAEIDGRRLTRNEMIGFANLTFAGGRDTIIQTIGTVFAEFARNPKSLGEVRANPAGIALAAEEFFRVATPLTHIGRVCPVATNVHGVEVPKDGRISLCWASANQDETVFKNPESVRLDRRPNPHLAFGNGAHFCLGAPHARLLIKTLLQVISNRIEAITIIDEQPHIEDEQSYARANGFDRLAVRITPRCERA